MKLVVSQCTRNHWGNSTKIDFLDFPGGPVVKTPSSSAGDVGLIPGQRSKISHAMEQLSLHTATKISRTTTRTQCSQIDTFKKYMYLFLDLPSETLGRQNWWSLGICIFHQCPEILMGSYLGLVTLL